jgi:hypothetical protein
MGIRPEESGDERNTGDNPRAAHLWIEGHQWGNPHAQHTCPKCRQPLLQSKTNDKQFGCKNCQLVMSL